MIHGSCSCPLCPDTTFSLSLAPSLLLSLAILSCLLALMCTLSVDWLMHCSLSQTLSNKQTLDNALLLLSLLLSLFFVLSYCVALLEEKSEDGGSVYFLFVNCCVGCCVAAASCGFLSQSSEDVFFYVMLDLSIAYCRVSREKVRLKMSVKKVDRKTIWNVTHFSSVK
jgi:hypothetical protein